MIQFTIGNILTADAEALVNTVNTVGIMGKGIALAFKKAYPANYKIYRQACDNKEFSIGQVLITQTGIVLPKYIINFPTKAHWRGRTKIEFIELGLKELVKTIKKKEIKSVAIPPLGCGNGGLKWEVVKPLILSHLKEVEHQVKIIIYEPGYNNQIVQPKQAVSLTPARAMLLCGLNNYQVLGYSINLLVAQKIAYFLQRFGEPLKLQYEKGHYGPYSHRLQHLLKRLNGYYLNFKHEATKPSTTVQLAQFDKVKVYSEQKLNDIQLARLSNVKMLIEGFESPYGLELLATIDFIYKQNNINDTQQIITEISNWTKRKKDIMKPFHIQVAYERLKEYYDAKKL